MNRSIPNVFIKNLLSITDIVDLISSHITLKKKGKNYYALCPFHNENNPSFTVNSEKQFFYCFGCHINGNAIDFLMRYENLEFIECIKELSLKNNLIIPYNTYNKKVFYINTLYSLIKDINNIYKKSLSKNTFALDYLINKRGINNKIIEKFDIGYSPINWFNTLKKNNKKYKGKINKYLYKIGILIKNQKNQIYDPFIQRIIFPIKNIQGKIIGFGGRLTNKSFHQPKYINSSETELFKKSLQMYGLYENCGRNKNIPYLLIVEGYMDVLSLTQYGIKYIISSLGTSISINQIKLIFNKTDNIICCYDGDIAGKKAAWNFLNLTIPYMNDGKMLKFIFLPQGEDPDSIIKKKGKIFFENEIKKSVYFYDFLFSILISKLDISKIEGLVKLSKLSIPMINKIPGKILRFFVKKELGKKIGIVDNLRLKKFLIELNTHKSFCILKKTNIRTLIALLIQNTHLAFYVKKINLLKKSKIIGINLFIKLVNICIDNPKINIGQIIEIYRNTHYINYIKKLAFWNHMIIDKNIEKIFKNILLNLYSLILRQKLDKIIAIAKIRKLSIKEKNIFWKINLLLKKSIK